MTDAGWATALLLVVVGLWLILRTVTHDDQGHNLVDRILSLG
jgi:hypothetical protein